MKVEYDGLKFDSQLEVDYYKYLKEKSLAFMYHPKKPIEITSGNNYYPDFIVVYDDRVEIVETKGFNQFSFMKDNMIHNVMLSKTEEELRQFVSENWKPEADFSNHKVVYRKIKYLQKYGWVDFDFKNPNTLANQRKAKIDELEQENKELRTFKREAIRYITYLKKPKLTKRQEEFKTCFEEKLQEEM